MRIRGQRGWGKLHSVPRKTDGVASRFIRKERGLVVYNTVRARIGVRERERSRTRRLNACIVWGLIPVIHALSDNIAGALIDSRQNRSFVFFNIFFCFLWKSQLVELIVIFVIFHSFYTWLFPLINWWNITNFS